MRIIVLLSYPQSRTNALYIHRNCSHNYHTCEQQEISILVEMFGFAVTHFDNFCKTELITVTFKLFDGKDASLVFLQTGTIIELFCSNEQLYTCNDDWTVRLLRL